MKFIGIANGSLLNAEAIVRIVPTQDSEGRNNGWLAETFNNTGELYCIGLYDEDSVISTIEFHRAGELIEEFLANKDIDGVLHIENGDNVEHLWKHRESTD